MRISHLKENFKILQSEIHMFCIPEEESLNVSTLSLFCFFQLVHSLLPSFLEFSWQEKQLSEVFLNTSRHSNLHILVCTFEDDS